GKSLGTATQFGISLGVALAHRDKKRVVVDLQPDGDLMFDAGAMWVAAKHRIPLLVVMYNNRAYYNDWEHQIRMAKLRGTPVARAHIGMDMSDPDPDFASTAKCRSSSRKAGRCARRSRARSSRSSAPFIPRPYRSLRRSAKARACASSIPRCVEAAKLRTAARCFPL